MSTGSPEKDVNYEHGDESEPESDESENGEESERSYNSDSSAEQSEDETSSDADLKKQSWHSGSEDKHAGIPPNVENEMHEDTDEENDLVDGNGENHAPNCEELASRDKTAVDLELEELEEPAFNSDLERDCEGELSLNTSFYDSECESESNDRDSTVMNSDSGDGESEQEDASQSEESDDNSFVDSSYDETEAAIHPYKRVKLGSSTDRLAPKQHRVIVTRSRLTEHHERLLRSRVVFPGVGKPRSVALAEIGAESSDSSSEYETAVEEEDELGEQTIRDTDKFMEGVRDQEHEKKYFEEKVQVRLEENLEKQWTVETQKAQVVKSNQVSSQTIPLTPQVVKNSSQKGEVRLHEKKLDSEKMNQDPQMSHQENVELQWKVETQKANVVEEEDSKMEVDPVLDDKFNVFEWDEEEAAVTNETLDMAVRVDRLKSVVKFKDKKEAKRFKFTLNGRPPNQIKRYSAPYGPRLTKLLSNSKIGRNNLNYRQKIIDKKNRLFKSAFRHRKNFVSSSRLKRKKMNFPRRKSAQAEGADDLIQGFLNNSSAVPDLNCSTNIVIKNEKNKAEFAPVPDYGICNLEEARSPQAQIVVGRTVDTASVYNSDIPRATENKNELEITKFVSKNINNKVSEVITLDDCDNVPVVGSTFEEPLQGSLPADSGTELSSVEIPSMAHCQVSRSEENTSPIKVVPETSNVLIGAEKGNSNRLAERSDSYPGKNEILVTDVSVNICEDSSSHPGKSEDNSSDPYQFKEYRMYTDKDVPSRKRPRFMPPLGANLGTSPLAVGRSHSPGPSYPQPPSERILLGESISNDEGNRSEGVDRYSIPLDEEAVPAPSFWDGKWSDKPVTSRKENLFEWYDTLISAQFSTDQERNSRKRKRLKPPMSNKDKGSSKKGLGESSSSQPDLEKILTNVSINIERNKDGPFYKIKFNNLNSTTEPLPTDFLVNFARGVKAQLQGLVKATSTSQAVTTTPLSTSNYSVAAESDEPQGEGMNASLLGKLEEGDSSDRLVTSEMENLFAATSTNVAECNDEGGVEDNVSIRVLDNLMDQSNIASPQTIPEVEESRTEKDKSRLLEAVNPNTDQSVKTIPDSSSRTAVSESALSLTPFSTEGGLSSLVTPASVSLDASVKTCSTQPQDVLVLDPTSLHATDRLPIEQSRRYLDQSTRDEANQEGRSLKETTPDQTSEVPTNLEKQTAEEGKTSCQLSPEDSELVETNQEHKISDQTSRNEPMRGPIVRDPVTQKSQFDPFSAEVKSALKECICDSVNVGMLLTVKQIRNKTWPYRIEALLLSLISDVKINCCRNCYGLKCSKYSSIGRLLSDSCFLFSWASDYKSKSWVHTIPLLKTPQLERLREKFGSGTHYPCSGQCGILSCGFKSVSIAALRRHIKERCTAAIKYSTLPVNSQERRAYETGAVLRNMLPSETKKMSWDQYLGRDAVWSDNCNQSNLHNSVKTQLDKVSGEQGKGPLFNTKTMEHFDRRILQMVQLLKTNDTDLLIDLLICCFYNALSCERCWEKVGMSEFLPNTWERTKQHRYYDKRKFCTRGTSTADLELEYFEVQLQRNFGTVPDAGYSVSFSNDKRKTSVSVAELNSRIRAKKNRSYLEKEEMRKRRESRLRAARKSDRLISKNRRSKERESVSETKSSARYPSRTVTSKKSSAPTKPIVNTPATKKSSSRSGIAHSRNSKTPNEQSHVVPEVSGKLPNAKTPPRPNILRKASEVQLTLNKTKSGPGPAPSSADHSYSLATQDQNLPDISDFTETKKSVLVSEENPPSKPSSTAETTENYHNILPFPSMSPLKVSKASRSEIKSAENPASFLSTFVNKPEDATSIRPPLSLPPLSLPDPSPPPPPLPMRTPSLTYQTVAASPPTATKRTRVAIPINPSTSTFRFPYSAQRNNQGLVSVTPISIMQADKSRQPALNVPVHKRVPVHNFIKCNTLSELQSVLNSPKFLPSNANLTDPVTSTAPTNPGTVAAGKTNDVHSGAANDVGLRFLSAAAASASPATLPASSQPQSIAPKPGNTLKTSDVLSSAAQSVGILCTDSAQYLLLGGPDTYSDVITQSAPPHQPGSDALTDPTTLPVSTTSLSSTTPEELLSVLNLKRVEASQADESEEFDTDYFPPVPVVAEENGSVRRSQRIKTTLVTAELEKLDEKLRQSDAKPTDSLEMQKFSDFPCVQTRSKSARSNNISDAEFSEPTKNCVSENIQKSKETATGKVEETNGEKKVKSPPSPVNSYLRTRNSLAKSVAQEAEELNNLNSLGKLRLNKLTSSKQDPATINRVSTRSSGTITRASGVTEKLGDATGEKGDVVDTEPNNGRKVRLQTSPVAHNLRTRNSLAKSIALEAKELKNQVNTEKSLLNNRISSKQDTAAITRVVTRSSGAITKFSAVTKKLGDTPVKVTTSGLVKKLGDTHASEKSAKSEKTSQTSNDASVQTRPKSKRLSKNEIVEAIENYFSSTTETPEEKPGKTLRLTKQLSPYTRRKTISSRSTQLSKDFPDQTNSSSMSTIDKSPVSTKFSDYPCAQTRSKSSKPSIGSDKPSKDDFTYLKASLSDPKKLSVLNKSQVDEILQGASGDLEVKTTRSGRERGSGTSKSVAEGSACAADSNPKPSKVRNVTTANSRVLDSSFSCDTTNSQKENRDMDPLTKVDQSHKEVSPEIRISKESDLMKQFINYRQAESPSVESKSQNPTQTSPETSPRSQGRSKRPLLLNKRPHHALPRLTIAPWDDTVRVKTRSSTVFIERRFLNGSYSDILDTLSKALLVRPDDIRSVENTTQSSKLRASSDTFSKTIQRDDCLRVTCRRPTEASDQGETTADEDLKHLQNVLLVVVRFPVSTHGNEENVSSNRVVWVANMDLSNYVLTNGARGILLGEHVTYIKRNEDLTSISYLGCNAVSEDSINFENFWERVGTEPLKKFWESFGKESDRVNEEDLIYVKYWYRDNVFSCFLLNDFTLQVDFCLSKTSVVLNLKKDYYSHLKEGAILEEGSLSMKILSSEVTDKIAYVANIALPTIIEDVTS